MDGVNGNGMDWCEESQAPGPYLYTDWAIGGSTPPSPADIKMVGET